MKIPYLIFLHCCILLNIKNECFSQSYSALGLGTNYAILDVYSDSLLNKIYIGGGFSLAGGIQSHCFAIWDGISWDSTRNQFPSPPTSQVRSIQVFNNKIYVGGTLGVFDTAGNQIGYGLAAWDSISQCWESDSVIGFVETLGIYNGDLIIGGNFTGINSIISNKIIGFNGINYFPFANLDTMSGGVLALQEYNNELYVGGNFDSQIAPNMKDLVKWDGSQWLSVGGGLSGFSTFINVMEIYQGKLIIGGWFEEANGDPGNGIAAWDGSQWSNFGSGVLNGGVRCMAIYNNDLWVGGSFNSIGGVSVTNIARWDGTQWYNVGLNLNNAVFEMSVLNNDLYIAGNFLTVNNDTVNNIIKYNSITGYSEIFGYKENLAIYPNPATNEITLKLNSKINGLFGIEIIDFKGRVVISDSNKVNSGTMNFNVSRLEQGIYLLKLRISENESKIGKVIISRR